MRVIPVVPMNRDAAAAWYQAQADAAQAPILRELLREARSRLGGADPLSARIDNVLKYSPAASAGQKGSWS